MIHRKILIQPSKELESTNAISDIKSGTGQSKQTSPQPTQSSSNTPINGDSSKECGANLDQSIEILDQSPIKMNLCLKIGMDDYASGGIAGQPTPGISKNDTPCCKELLIQAKLQLLDLSQTIEKLSSQVQTTTSAFKDLMSPTTTSYGMTSSSIKPTDATYFY